MRPARQLQVDTSGETVRVHVDGLELQLPLPPYVEPAVVVDTKKGELRITISADQIVVDGQRR